MSEEEEPRGAYGRRRLFSAGIAMVGGDLFVLGAVIFKPEARADLEPVHLGYALVLLLAGSLALYFGWPAVKHYYKRQ